MKTITSLLVACLFCCVMYAQNNTINYKALVKDDLGNVVASQGINVRFTIYADAVQVYEETHNPTTDANGIIILDIGSGTTVNVFADIDWSTTTSLKTEIDTGSGYVDMGTTAFKSVPYAINAGNTAFSTTANVTSNAPGDIDTDDFVFGSIQLAHSADPSITDNRMFFDKSKGAFRAGATYKLDGLSYPLDGTTWDDANVGDHSFASGINTTASGFAATAMGVSTTASGESSTAMGWNTSALGTYATAIGFETTASGGSSTTMGQSTTASGSSSTAMGQNTEAIGIGSLTTGIYTQANAIASTAIGRYNIGGGNQSFWVETDPLFEIGNGFDEANRTNALTVLKNGTITAPSFDLVEITDPKALVTKEYVDSGAGASGLEQIMEGGNIGWRIKGQDPANYGDIGSGAVDLSIGTSSTEGATGNYSFAVNNGSTASGNYSTAMGYNANASGFGSIAMGYATNSSEVYSTAMGYSTIASGPRSTTLGGHTTASGNSSIAMGSSTTASGDYSTAMGQSTKSESYASTSIGHYNIGGGNPTSWIETDPLFEIGNGTFSSSANALTVLKNGNTTINGQTTVNEDTANLSAHAISGIKTHTGNIDAYGIFGKNDVSDFYGFGVFGLGGYVGTYGLVHPTGSSSYFGILGQVLGTNTSGTNYGVYGTASSGVGATNYAVYSNGDLAHTGALINASDRKLKTNISTINNSLENIMRLNPATYLIRENYQKTMNMSSSQQFGFIAQELQEVFPDLVSRNIHPGATKQDASIEYLGVNYIGLIPVLTKGIQEQQATIETLEEKVERQEQVIASLVARLEALENR
ncbi:tail fiber domain-containing protein [Winogradskyella pulchriflava]|uniref:Tail fiber domain-containing protein n=1 Tax=Winogradskyella pulchriflava TaxID=1110688 RepID=A0ABV6Q4E3_9FLAO